MLPMFHAWEYLTLPGTLAPQLFGDDHRRRVGQTIREKVRKRNEVPRWDKPVSIFSYCQYCQYCQKYLASAGQACSASL
jgi:hypothetical protein